MPPLSKNHEREIRALARRKERARRGRYLAEGPHLVRELLRLPEQFVLLVAEEQAATSNPETQNLVARAQTLGIPVETVNAAGLRALTTTENPAPVLAVVAREVFPPLAEFLARDTLRVLVLDGVQDPGNAGTLVRAAAAFGVTFVLAGPGTCDLYNPKAVRASMGGVFHLPVLTTRHWSEAVLLLKEAGIDLVASVSGGDSYLEFAWPARFALALGSEARGLVPELLQAAATRLGIPQTASVESLNAAMAGAILLAHAFGTCALGAPRTGANGAPSAADAESSRRL